MLQYPFIIETPGCDNDILHLLEKCPDKPQISYSFRDDTLIMAFVKKGLGVTISQKLVLDAFGKTTNSVVTRNLLKYLQSNIDDNGWKYTQTLA